MATSFGECLRWSLSDARETEPVLMSKKLDAAAPPHAMLAAFVFVLAVAALLVAAFGCGLARLPWLDPPGVCPARPSRWDLLCFQHVLVFVVGVGMLAAMSAAMVVVFLVLCLFLLLVIKISGAKNEATFLSSSRCARR